ncbi:RNA-binding transcriptional accessory protein [Ferrimonas sediminicola]|uniref:RNA-binding transcriptional accessory protein n=1 Tax=Ferrimonas sediminicola TaxID=2569538 RepID=A0A4U1BC75_9GAMM|nr:Tex family protein [Ferrimonas sediminicola]TKB47631.1 RNA-binding transcriptional accessory protein [Ferrimonas sediminicola]
MQTLAQRLAQELEVRTQQVDATIALLDEGATVPFIARYRKEVTGGLDDTQLRQLDARLTYLRELDARRQTILQSIEQQGKLDTSLLTKIQAAATKTELEDLYLPYKPKRRTKGQIAIEAGLEPLADKLLAQRQLIPETEAEAFFNSDAGFDSTKAVLDGARAILMERFAEQAEVIASVREHMRRQAQVEVRLIPGQEQAGAKFRDYFEHDEPLAKIPSHRALAMLRGRNEGVLAIGLNADPHRQEGQKHSICESLIAQALSLNLGSQPADLWLKSVVQWTWKVKLSLQMESELLTALRERAEADAIKVFADNLGDLLMAAPAGPRATLGLDPGLRTGVKVVVVDHTGKLLATDTIYPHAPRNQWDPSIQSLARLAKAHRVELVAIGNGTASRETDKLAADLQKRHPELKLERVMVSEAGASVYSASETAAKEFPDLDVSLRGAVSIARRLQDPLAELVKIEPKSIGVGQYQHDVSQTQLAHSLDAVVEDCVNAVGVDLNTASAALLTRVAGLSRTLAQNLVAFRDQHGRFSERKQLLKVPRLGPKAFEQCAGFLRINGGSNPLDASGVHPESYSLVQRIADHTGQPIDALIGNGGVLRSLKPAQFVSDQFGLPTVTDVLAELEKPGRDPRGQFETAQFADGVETLKDLEPGMVLQGVVTNVTHFGAFVDIGVHQDGLVHISALSHQFVEDPRKVVKTGDVVKVKVMEVEIDRKRIGLSMRLDDEPGQQKAPKRDSQPQGGQPRSGQRQQQRNDRQSRGDSASGAMGNAFADAFKRAKR